MSRGLVGTFGGAAVLTAVLALASVTGAAAQPLTFDWDGGLDTVGTLADRGAGISLDMQDSAGFSLQLDHGLGPGAMTYSVSGSLVYAPQRISGGEPRLDSFILYPGNAAVQWESAPARLNDPWLRAALGRIDAEEPTGLLLRDPDAVHPGQLMNGLDVEFRYLWFFAAVQAGYLGLLDKRVNRIRFSPQDQGELADTAWYPAPPRGLAIVRLEADELPWGQHAALFGILQKDFRTGSPAFDSWYIGAAAGGPIAFGLSHESSLIVALTVPSPGDVGAGVLLSSELAYRLPLAPLHEAWLSARWASGQGGGLAAFPQLAGPPLSTAYPEPLTDAVRLELGIDASLPAPPAGGALRPGLAARLLLSPGGTVPAGYAFAPAGPYVGTETELALAYDPLSGLRVRARGGVLITAGGVLPFVRMEAGVSL